MDTSGDEVRIDEVLSCILLGLVLAEERVGLKDARSVLYRVQDVYQLIG